MLSSQLAFSTFPATHKNVGPFWCCFPGGWACVRSRTLWISPTDSPVRLGVSPTASTPTGVFCQRFEALFPRAGTPGLCGLSRSPVVPPSLSHVNVGLPAPPAAALPISTPPTGLDECFFFNSLVVGLPYSWIFWPFWLVFVLKFVVALWFFEESQRVYLHLRLGWKIPPDFLSTTLECETSLFHICAPSYQSGWVWIL